MGGGAVNRSLGKSQKVLDRPSKDDYEVVVTSAPTADITDLDTSRLNNRSNTSWYENKA